MKRYTKNRIDIVDQSICFENEIFLDITEEMVPGVYDYYKISNYGRVFHTYLNRILKLGWFSNDYRFVSLSGSYGTINALVHRLEMMAFCPIENPHLFRVNHLNTVRYDNRLENLYWCTSSENTIHSYFFNPTIRGENSRLSKITKNQAIDICVLLATSNMTNKEIAKITNSTESIVQSIRSGESWKYESFEFIDEFKRRKGRLFDEKMVRDMCSYFQNTPKGDLTVNDHCRNALTYYGYDIEDNIVDSARKIYNRKYYRNISDEYNF